jgi:hypothetical protein
MSSIRKEGFSIVAEAGSRSTPVRTRSQAVQTRTGWQSALYVPYRHRSATSTIRVGTVLRWARIRRAQRP